MRKRSDQPKTSVWILVTILFLTVWYCSGDGNHAKKQSLSKSSQRVVEHDEPLRVTEVSPLNNDFRTIFCVNKYIHWPTQTKMAGIPTEIKWNYQLTTSSGGTYNSDDLNLEVLSITGVGQRYKKKSPDSKWCYEVSLYYQLKKIPFLQYQKGYNTKTQREMHLKEEAERNTFFFSITKLTVNYFDSKDNERLLSFRAK